MIGELPIRPPRGYDAAYMRPSRHIVYINEFFHPDICASAAVLTEQLPRIAAARPDWRITVLAGNRAWEHPEVRYSATDEFRGVAIRRVPRSPVPHGRRGLGGRLAGFIEFGRGVLRAGRDLGPVDLVIGTTAPPHGGRIARRLAERLGCPFIYRVLDVYPDIASALGRASAWNPAHLLWLASDTRTMVEAAAVVTVTEPMTRRLVGTRDLPAEKVVTLHDGFDPARVATRMPVEYRRKYNPDDCFVVQYAGNMGLSHPFDTIIAAAERLRRDERLLFQFVGDGPQRPVVEAALRGSARFIDYQPAEALGDVLAMSDVCLISQHEAIFDLALPYKIYACLAARRPVIFVGNAKSEIAAWLHELRAGVCVSQGDVDGLVEAIERYRWHSDPAEPGGAAQTHPGLPAHLHADAVTGRWIQIIERVLGQAASTVAQRHRH